MKKRRRKFQPVPYKAYLRKTLEQLMNKRLLVNLAIQQVLASPEHKNYDRALRYYSIERNKIQKAINQKEREAGIEPPPQVVGMKCVETSARAGMKEQVELSPEAQNVLAIVHQMVQQFQKE